MISETSNWTESFYFDCQLKPNQSVTSQGLVMNLLTPCTSFFEQETTL